MTIELGYGLVTIKKSLKNLGSDQFVLCSIGHVYPWLGELEVSGMDLRKVQVGAEGCIGPLLLKAQDLYLKQGQTWKL